MQWQRLPDPPFNAYALLAGSGKMLFACSGQTLYAIDLTLQDPKSRDWQQGPRLPGSCLSMRVAPSAPTSAGTLVVLHYSASVANTLDVSAVNFSSGTLQPLGFAMAANLCSGGRVGVWVAKGSSTSIPEAGYDVFASDCQYFYVFTVSGWAKLGGVQHIDTWSMAFSPNYDPASGNCTAYSASDGGIHAIPPPRPGTNDICYPSMGWVRASSGLHIMSGGFGTGVNDRSCANFSLANCVALYLPTADDDTWVTTKGGETWKYAGTGLGDATQAWVDPALPSQVLAARNSG